MVPFQGDIRVRRPTIWGIYTDRKRPLLVNTALFAACVVEHFGTNTESHVSLQVAFSNLGFCVQLRDRQSVLAVLAVDYFDVSENWHLRIKLGPSGHLIIVEGHYSVGICASS